MRVPKRLLQRHPRSEPLLPMASGTRSEATQEQSVAMVARLGCNGHLSVCIAWCWITLVFASELRLLFALDNRLPAYHRCVGTWKHLRSAASAVAIGADTTPNEAHMVVAKFRRQELISPHRHSQNPQTKVTDLIGRDDQYTISYTCSTKSRSFVAHTNLQHHF
jgi:hypothetical protein